MTELVLLATSARAQLVRLDLGGPSLAARARIVLSSVRRRSGLGDPGSDRLLCRDGLDAVDRPDNVMLDGEL